MKISKNENKNDYGNNDKLFNLKVEENCLILFDKMLLGVIFQNPEGVISYANPAATRLSGLSKNEVLNISPLHHGIDPFNGDASAESIKDNTTNSVIVTDVPVKGMIAGLYNQERKVYLLIELTATPFFRSGGKKPYQVVITFNEITANKEDHNNFRISEKRCKTLIENAGLGIGYFSTEGVIKAFNIEALKNMGGTEEDYIGKNVKEVFGNVAGRKYIKRFKLVAVSDHPLKYEDHLVINGEPAWFKSTQSRIMNETGAVDGIQVIAENITGTKLSDQALKESEEKFRLITEKSVIGICIIQDSKLVYVNPILSKMFGCSPEELTNHPDPTDFIHPEDLNLLLGKIKGRLKGESQSGSSVYRAIRRDGAGFYIEAQSKRIEYKGKNAVLGTMIDITDRKMMEEALKKSELEYRGIFENSILAICQSLPTGKLLRVNKAYAEMFGFSSPEEMLNEVSDIGNQLYIESSEVQKIIDFISKDGFMAPAEIEFKRRNGQSFYALVGIKAVKDISGKIMYIQAEQIEITDRKKAVEESISMAKEWNQTFNAASDAICVLGPNNKILRWNSAMNEILRADGNKIKGYYCWELMHNTSVQISDCPVERMKKSLKRESSVFEKDGQLYEVTVDPIVGENGLYEGAVHIMRDITDREKAAADLRNSEFKYHIVADNTFDWEFWQTPQNDFLYHSPSCIRITGYSPEDFIKNPSFIEEIIYPEDLPGYLNHKLEFRDKRIPGQAEFRIIDKDNNIKWIDHVCSPIYDNHGTFLGTRGSNRDCSDRKNAEIMLNNKVDELEQFNSLTVNRELRMVELKNEVNELLEKLGENKKYRIAR